jgi:hypothetical protein
VEGDFALGVDLRGNEARGLLGQNLGTEQDGYDEE